MSEHDHNTVRNEINEYVAKKTDNIASITAMWLRRDMSAQWLQHGHIPIASCNCPRCMIIAKQEQDQS